MDASSKAGQRRLDGGAHSATNTVPDLSMAEAEVVVVSMARIDHFFVGLTKRVMEGCLIVSLDHDEFGDFYGYPYRYATKVWRDACDRSMAVSIYMLTA